MLKKHFIPLIAVWMLTLPGSVLSLEAQLDEGREVNREYAIKAAYLYQFGRYVQWPAQSFTNDNSPLVIGVLGRDPFEGVLDEIARTKRIGNRPVAVRIIPSMAEYKPCNILFVPSSVSLEEKTAAIEEARRSPLLLVGEEPGFAEQGGTMNFFTEENMVRFTINIKVVKKDQLKISSKLLSLAKIVEHY